MGKKIILITGASRGIGRAIAENLVDHKTIITGRKQADLQNLAKLIQDKGGETLPLVCDVTDENMVEECIKEATEHFGKIDVLINNAGIGKFKRVDEFTSKEFHEVYNTNMLGTFLFTKYVTPAMIKQKKGQIINIASVAGLNGFKGGTAYASSKFAMVGFTESLREDLKEFGIAVTAVCPGSVFTEFGGIDISKKQNADYMLMPSDVARTIRYLIEESETANAKLIELKPRRKQEFR